MQPINDRNVIKLEIESERFEIVTVDTAYDKKGKRIWKSVYKS